MRAAGRCTWRMALVVGAGWCCKWPGPVAFVLQEPEVKHKGRPLGEGWDRVCPCVHTGADNAGETPAGTARVHSCSLEVLTATCSHSRCGVGGVPRTWGGRPGCGHTTTEPCGWSQAIPVAQTLSSWCQPTQPCLCYGGYWTLLEQ